MDTKNVLLAVILSSAVLFFWALFFEQPTTEKQIYEKQLSKKLIIYLFKINWNKFNFFKIIGKIEIILKINKPTKIFFCSKIFKLKSIF